MEWSGQEGYGQSLDEPWYNQDTFKQAGEVRSYGGLTFLRVFDAGHMVGFLLSMLDAVGVSMLNSCPMHTGAL